MKVCLPSEIDMQGIGGGWSFTRNFASVMPIANYNEADIYFIPSSSMIPDTRLVEAAKADGKKVVLRCDNIVRNSRNRNSGMSRMKTISEMADLVVFQSKFAEELLNPYLRTENFVVILNSVDQSIFNDSNRTKSDYGRFMYSKQSSDETKNWEMARVTYQLVNQNAPESTLNLVGRFDTNVEQYNFDFYQNENFKYWGHITDPNYMASIYKQSDYFLCSYFNDACSQTIIEALSCGLKIMDCFGMSETGGTPEILDAVEKYGIEFFGLPRMKVDYLAALEKL